MNRTAHVLILLAMTVCSAAHAKPTHDEQRSVRLKKQRLNAAKNQRTSPPEESLPIPDFTLPSGAEGETVVQNILLPGPTGSLNDPLAVPVVPEPPPPVQETFRFKGWGKLNLAYPWKHPPEEPLDVPREKFPSYGQLFLEAHYAHPKTLQARVSGLLDLRSSVKIKPEDRDRVLFEPVLREAFVEGLWGSVSVRLGQQRFVWGRGDAIAPNDILNAKDLRDPILSETELLYLPTLMVRADWDMGFGVLQGTVSPFHVLDRFEVYGRNWALIQPEALPTWRGLAQLAARSADLELAPAVDTQWMWRQPKNIATPSAGARFLWTWGNSDFSLMYHAGYAARAHVTVDPSFLAALSTLDLSTVTPAQAAGLLAGRDPNHPPIQTEYVRRHHAGLDVQTTLGPFGLHADLAFDSAVVVVTEALDTRVRPSVQAAVGMEWNSGELGKVLQWELGYQRLLGAALDTPLLGMQRDTVTVAALGRWTFFEELALELRASTLVQPWSVTLRPQVSWKPGNLELRLGATVLLGDPASLAYYYRYNTGTYVAVRYLF